MSYMSYLSITKVVIIFISANYSAGVSISSAVDAGESS